MNVFRSLRHTCSRSGSLGRGLAGVAVFAAGLLAAGMFTSSVPAAPRDCLPLLGCLTTTIPTITLPTTTLTLPISTTTTTASGGATTSTTDTGSTTATTTTATDTNKTAEGPAASLSVTSSVRVLGTGARRSIELRLRLTQAARVSAVLSRNGKTLQRREFTAQAGPSLWRLQIGRTVKPGAATLGLTYRSSTGETARSSHRLRLPR